MYVIAIVSQKGGVGKSTLAVHLATEAQCQGQRVLLLDLDPQGSAMEWANRRGDLPPDVSGANPASIAKEIERAKSENYDLVIADTAPHADHAALQAARVADLVAIPCRPSTRVCGHRAHEVGCGAGKAADVLGFCCGVR
jgi:chromosome partitioning protein